MSTNHRCPEERVANHLGSVLPCACGGSSLQLGAITLHLGRHQVADFLQLARGVQRSAAPSRPPAAPDARAAAAAKAAEAAEAAEAAARIDAGADAHANLDKHAAAAADLRPPRRRRRGRTSRVYH